MVQYNEWYELKIYSNKQFFNPRCIDFNGHSCIARDTVFSMCIRV